MASDADPVPVLPVRQGGTGVHGGAAAQRASWRSRVALSSGHGCPIGRIERFLAAAGADRAPWLAVCFGCGIAAWFVLPRVGHWVAAMAAALGVAGVAMVRRSPAAVHPLTRVALAGAALCLAAGIGHVWLKSVLLGVPGLERPFAGLVTGRVLTRDDRAAEHEVRLVLAIRDPLQTDRAIRVRVRVRVPEPAVPAGLARGAVIRLPVRLMPPPPPILPGGHDFARAAWFDGLAATGTASGGVVLLTPGREGGGLAPLRSALSDHIAGRLVGSAGGIAAALASGDRGGIAQADEDALRDAGLSHLLSVSGLHVSAVIAATYWAVLRLLALLPWLALRVRIPLCASAGAALAGVFYTLLTGAEVPTVRSMVGALLVLAAVALGREPLSVRLLALAALAVMLLWPEAVMGPSFQLSFAAVLAIVALHGAGWMRRFTAPREEGLWQAALRRAGGLLLTGLVIEIALLPIGLYHFHRAGLLGALANMVAIPLTTVVIMPAVALGLTLDLVGAGGPAWWFAGQALGLLLGLAHAVARVPGAVALSPSIGGATYALFLGGGLWLALWQGEVRRWASVPLALAAMQLAITRAPDVLVSRDGRHVAVAGLVPGRLVLLREPRGGYAQDALNEMAGLDAAPLALSSWPGARCNGDFCGLALRRGGRAWQLLLAQGQDPVPLRDLAAACERSDLVISDRRLPNTCRPRWLKLDRAVLAQTGGAAIDLERRAMTTVNAPVDDHGWRLATPRSGAWPAGARPQ